MCPNTRKIQEKSHFFGFFVVFLNSLHYICNEFDETTVITINNSLKLQHYEQNRFGREDCSRCWSLKG